ncbi:MAG: 5'-methylthioadenosine phosphorylase [Myxococcales bacterium]|nr:5'-methylthioadenosine phosphorylase [Myxococcales bacterium]
MSLPSRVPHKASVAVTLGSAFSKKAPKGLELEPICIATPWGKAKLYKVANSVNPHPGYIIFRHGLPHETLPHLVNYRAYAAALKELNCAALLVTSSVGVLDEITPLNQAMLVSDLLMPDNRLPNGDLCTMFDRLKHDLPLSETLQFALKPGHLVLKSGLFSARLNEQVSQILKVRNIPLIHELTFAYAPGPRTKTKAENHYWRTLGAQVNSMSLGPEVILANELEIPCSALVVGHKRSLANKSSSLIETQTTPQSSTQLSLETSKVQDEVIAMSQSLSQSHSEFESLIVNFIQTASPVTFENYIYRFSEVKS